MEPGLPPVVLEAMEGMSVPSVVRPLVRREGSTVELEEETEVLSESERSRSEKPVSSCALVKEMGVSSGVLGRTAWAAVSCGPSLEPLTVTVMD